MKLNPERLAAYRPGPLDASYDARTCILYALGIGIGMDPTSRDQIRFVHERELAAFPTLAAVLGWSGRFIDPEYGVDAAMVVHGGQTIAWRRPLRIADRLTSDPRVIGIADKGPGKHALIRLARDLVASDGAIVATIEDTIIARGQGGFGGEATDTAAPRPSPERSPDERCDLATPPNLALIYRLSGDDNPLHIDPATARRAGFPRPILHGAATLGVAAHAVLRTCAGYDPARLAQIEARFSHPVFPGDTIRTELWRQEEEIAFRCRVVERGETVLTNGWARLR